MTREGRNTSSFRSRRGRAGPIRQNGPGRDLLTEGRRRGGSLRVGVTGAAKAGRSDAPHLSPRTNQRSRPEAGGGGGGGEQRSTWATWQPFPALRDPSPFGRPPALSRLAAVRLLFPGRTESGSVSPPGARRASPPGGRRARQPCAAPESAVVAAGKGCGPAAPRRTLDDAAPASTPSACFWSRYFIHGKEMPCIMDLSSQATEMAHVAGGCHIDIAVLEDGESYDTINLIKRSFYYWIVQDI
nr:uncharacterized protein LOC102396011 isoform X1 [Bubalus bubalis]